MPLNAVETSFQICCRYSEFSTLNVIVTLSSVPLPLNVMLGASFAQIVQLKMKLLIPIIVLKLIYIMASIPTP